LRVDNPELAQPAMPQLGRQRLRTKAMEIRNAELLQILRPLAYNVRFDA
jgi:hypothetical protein